MQHLAAENNLAGIKQLSEFLGLTISNLYLLTDNALAQVIRGVPFDQVTPPLFRDSSSTQLAYQHLWLRSRVCPACIADRSIGSAETDYPLSVSCPAHRLMLVDNCNVCAEPLTYLRRRATHCDCGQSLSALPQIPAGLEVQLYFCVFAPWRLATDWARNEVELLEAETHSALLLNTLIGEILGGESNESRCKPWIGMQDWPIISKLLDDFPTTLGDHIYELIATTDLKRRFDLLTRAECSSLPILRTLIPGIRARLRNLRRTTEVISETGVPVRLVALDRVRNIAKLDAQAVRELFHGNFFSFTTISDNEAGGRYWVPEAEAESVLAWFDQTADPTEAGKILGCSLDIIRCLTNIGILSAEHLAVKTRSPRYRRSVLDNHLLTLMGHVKASRKLNDLVPLAQVSPRSRLGNRPNKGWIRLIECVLAGSIDMFRIPGQIGWSAAGIRQVEITKILGLNWKRNSVPD